MILRVILSLFIIFQTWLPIVAFAATEFTITVKSSGGDQTSLSLAESIADEDLTAADIKVFSISAASTPTLVDGEIVAGVTSLATGVCVHVNAARTQVLIKTIVGTFQSGEVVKKSTDAAVTVTLSNAGDSPIAGIALYASASPDTTPVTIVGWTTNATNYISIYTPTSERHPGKFLSTQYFLDTSATNAQSILTQEEYVRIDGLQVKSMHNNNVMGVSTIAAGGSDIRISNNILIGTSSASLVQRCITINDADVTVKIWNNVLYNCATYTGDTLNYAIRITSSTAAYIYNNTINGPGYGGISAEAGTVVAKNNIVTGFGNTTAYNGTFDAATNYNSTDGTDTTGQGANSRTSQTFTFIGSSAGDFHLASTDTGALNFGTDLSGDANLAFTNDIDSIITRYGTWDIGADELGFIATSVGGASRPIIRGR